MADISKSLNKAYDIVVDDEDERVCKEIPESACNVVPQNFFLILLSLFFTKLADSLANAKTVLPWLLRSTGAPEALIALLVPIRESGSLIPQLALGGLIRAYKIRKYFYVLGCLGQALSIALMVLSALLLENWLAGLAIISALMFFSLARGLCSIANKDVIGKTIPKTRRGRLNGLSASLAGLMTIGIAAFMYSGMISNPNNFILLLWLACATWVAAALIFWNVIEKPGATDGGANGIKHALSKFSLLKTDKPFRRFVIIRALFMSSGLAAPFLVTMASQTNQTNDLNALTLFVALSGVAGLLGGPIWGRLSDWNSLIVLMISGASISVICLITVFISVMNPDAKELTSLCLFFLLMLCHEGVRLGRKTYLIDMASGNKRTDYVSLSNTIIGVMLFVVGFITAFIAHLSIAAVMLVFSVNCFIATVLSFREQFKNKSHYSQD